LKSMEAIVSASLACADFGHLADVIAELDEAGVGLYHFDVVDGRFSPTFIMGPAILASLRHYSKTPFEAHLACWEPEKYIDQFAEAGTDYFAFHLEATVDPVYTASLVRNNGMLPVLGLRPETPAEAVTEEIIKEVDMILVLTVHPGFAGQAFLPEVLEKLEKLSRAIARINPGCLLEADGNIHEMTIPEVTKRGARVLIGGTSGLFRRDRSLAESIRIMKNSAANF